MQGAARASTMHLPFTAFSQRLSNCGLNLKPLIYLFILAASPLIAGDGYGPSGRVPPRSSGSCAVYGSQVSGTLIGHPPMA